jgi:PAS domain S-box-containing protein
MPPEFRDQNRCLRANLLDDGIDQYLGISRLREVSAGRADAAIGHNRYQGIMDTRPQVAHPSEMEWGLEATGLRDELSRVVDALPGIVWTALPDGQLDFLNQRWREYTGLRVDKACGSGWQDAIHSDDLPKLLERWGYILASAEPGEVEARLRRLDGVYRWFLFRFCPLADRSGQAVKWCGIISDIDDRKRTEDDLRIRNGEFRSIADNIPALIALMKPNGEVETVNRQTREYFGATLEELIHWASADAVHPEDLPRVIAAWSRSVATEEPYDIEHRVRRADGVYRWFHLRGLPARDSEGRVVRWCVLQTDIEEKTRNGI